MSTVSSELEYGGWRAKERLIMDYIVGLGSGTDDYLTGGESGFKNKICKKVSDTAPQDDTADDMPRQLGDICMHYNTSGVLQGVYVATVGDLSSTCTWSSIFYVGG
jgi:hypothetical protein